MYASLMQKARAGMVACGLLAAGPLWAQQAQLELTGLSILIPGNPAPTPYGFTPHSASGVTTWTLDQLPTPQVDIHGKVTFIGTLTNSLAATASFDGGMLFPAVPNTAPSWLYQGGTPTRFDMEEALTSSFYYEWTDPVTHAALAPGDPWTGTLFSIWLDNVTLDTQLDLAMVSFNIQDFGFPANLVFNSSSTSVNFGVGDYTSPSLGIGAPEPGTIALALAALAVVGGHVLLRLRRRRQPVAT